MEQGRQVLLALRRLHGDGAGAGQADIVRAGQDDGFPEKRTAHRALQLLFHGRGAGLCVRGAGGLRRELRGGRRLPPSPAPPAAAGFASGSRGEAGRAPLPPVQHPPGLDSSGRGRDRGPGPEEAGAGGGRGRRNRPEAVRGSGRAPSGRWLGQGARWGRFNVGGIE